MTLTEPASVALLNRSIRSIHTELSFLAENELLSAEKVKSIIELLPSTTSPLTGYLVHESPTVQPEIAGNRIQNTLSSVYEPPSNGNTPNSIASATTLYTFNARDPGDLEIHPNDKISVYEYINDSWSRGLNHRTGHHGVFPRNFVQIHDEKHSVPVKPPPPPPPPRVNSDVSNLPLHISEKPHNSTSGFNVTNKGNEMGKKLGKKLGNAAIFGAGASIGSNIVNSIF